MGNGGKELLLTDFVPVADQPSVEITVQNFWIFAAFGEVVESLHCAKSAIIRMGRLCQIRESYFTILGTFSRNHLVRPDNST